MTFAIHPLRVAPRAAPQRARLRGWAVAVLLALAVLQVLVGSLGHMHQIVHGVPHAHSAVAWSLPQNPLASAPIATATAGHDAPHAHGWLAALFDGHHSTTDCEWFDRMALGSDGPLPTLPALNLLPPDGFIAWTLHALLLRQSPALFWARGPPASLG